MDNVLVEAMLRLLDVYARRTDLQQAFPEVLSKDYRRLIEWACGVVQKKWEDSDYSTLEPYRNQFESMVANLSLFSYRSQFESLLLVPETRELGIVIGRQWKVENPIDLLTPNTFDVTAKTIYARSYLNGWRTDWATNLYVQHLNVWSGLYEHIPKKTGAQDYLAVYNKMLEDIRTERFDFSKSPIPVNERGNVINGRHRLAAAIALGKPVEVKQDDSIGQEVCDYWYLRDLKSYYPEGLTTKWADAMAIEYCRLKGDVYVVTIFAEHTREEVFPILRKWGAPVYEKSIALEANGLFNLMREMYLGEPWLGGPEDGYSGAREAAAIRSRIGNGTVEVYLIELSSLDHARFLKNELRAIYQVGSESVHINDTREQALRLCRVFSSDRSLDFLNKATLKPFSRYETLLGEYGRFLRSLPRYAETCVGDDDFAIGGGAVLSAYGLRDVGDLDYFSRNNVTADDGGLSNDNEQLRYYGVNIDELLFNPQNHFWHRGFKYVTLSAVREMKATRNEPRDKEDVRLIDSLQR